jgi:hypothetical protein
MSDIYKVPQNRVTELQEVHDAEFSFDCEKCLKRLSEFVRLGVVRRAKRIDLVVEPYIRGTHALDNIGGERGK